MKKKDKEGKKNPRSRIHSTRIRHSTINGEGKMLCSLTCRQTRFNGLLPVPEHLELRQRHVGRYLNRIEAVIPLVADVGHRVPNWIEGVTVMVTVICASQWGEYSQLSISMKHSCLSMGKYCKSMGQDAVIVSLQIETVEE